MFVMSKKKQGFWLTNRGFCLTKQGFTLTLAPGFLAGQLPVFLQTLWDVCLLDITSTLKNVSGKACGWGRVLAEHS